MKKMKPTNVILIVFLSIISLQSYAQSAISASEIIAKADEKFNGEESAISVMAMTIVRPTWERTIEFKSWTKGSENSLTLITAPSAERVRHF